MGQREKTWFEDAEDCPSEELRKDFCDYTDDSNPFSKYVGNESAVKRLNRAAYSAFGKYNHCCRDQSFALLGPASAGKTTLAKMFAELVDLPFVEISPRSIKTLDDILMQIAKVCETTEIETDDDDEGYETLELWEYDGGKFILPPMVVFIDEVHALRDNIVQGLLKATEKKDAVLVTEGGWTVNCFNVCWMIATTERGSLFDAFDTRFTKINLRLYSLEEISQIININYPEWDKNVCDLVARYAGRVPREALAFAKEMSLEYEMNGGDFEEIASIVAEDNGIDKFGMTYQRLDILRALKDGPISKNRMVDIAQCKIEELEKYVMPSLMARTPDQNPLVAVSSKGFCITEDGKKELSKRGI